MAYKIALVGASQDEENEFRQLLGTAAQRLRQSWEVSNERDADLVVVDVDSVFGHMAWLKASAAGKRTAAFTGRDSARESDLLLGRPLSQEGLVKLLLMYNLPSMRKVRECVVTREMVLDRDKAAALIEKAG